jgi:hypothetical protein
MSSGENCQTCISAWRVVVYTQKFPTPLHQYVISAESITFYLQLHYVTESLLHLTMSYSYSYLACQQIPIRAPYRACKKLFF